MVAQRHEAQGTEKRHRGDESFVDRVLDPLGELRRCLRGSLGNPSISKGTPARIQDDLFPPASCSP